MVPCIEELAESQRRLQADLRYRGLRCAWLVIGDGHLGIWAALRNVYPEAEEQWCWNHCVVNMPDPIGRRDEAVALDLLRDAACAETAEAAGRANRASQQWCRQGGHDDAGLLLSQDWEMMTTFHRSPGSPGAIGGANARHLLGMCQ